VKRFLKIITNKYIIALILFALLILVFDQNDWFTQRAATKELKDLESKIEHLKAESERMEQEVNELNKNPAKVEQIAREKFFEKKDGEDVYVIINDTIVDSKK
jgi:cell division protein DivIC